MLWITTKAKIKGTFFFLPKLPRGNFCLGFSFFFLFFLHFPVKSYVSFCVCVCEFQYLNCKFAIVSEVNEIKKKVLIFLKVTVSS